MGSVTVLYLTPSRVAAGKFPAGSRGRYGGGAARPMRGPRRDTMGAFPYAVGSVMMISSSQLERRFT